MSSNERCSGESCSRCVNFQGNPSEAHVFVIKYIFNKMYDVCSLLNGENNIHDLYLDYNMIDGYWLEEHLVHILSNNTKIRKLHMGFNNLGYGGACDIAKIIKSNNTIESLFLARNNMGSYGSHNLSATLIADALRENTSIHTINLHGNMFGPEGVRIIADMLATNTRIHSISLGANEMSEMGMFHLAKALKQNTTIHTIDLSGNLICTEGGRILADVLKHNTRIHTIDFGWSGNDNEESRYYHEIVINRDNGGVFDTLEKRRNGYLIELGWNGINNADVIREINEYLTRNRELAGII